MEWLVFGALVVVLLLLVVRNSRRRPKRRSSVHGVGESIDSGGGGD
ncbi:hypothetical protein ACL03H_22540 [Saccharopolyspora sp. MS10]